MSRIRSIHPGLWTDEAFMSLSAYARLLYIGLWNEAFDDGVFEWKPLTLKAKLFPVDTVDVRQLLAELVNAGCIKECAQVGKPYGLIRNFRVYQRPKKPNSSGMLRPEDEEYVGLAPNQYVTGGENSPQMEDGGGRMEEDQKASPSLRAERWEKGRRVPEGWKAWAITSFPSVDLAKILAEIRQFEEYWPTKPGKAGARTDWEAQFHMWMRNKFGASEIDQNAPPSPSLVVLSENDPVFAMVERARGKRLIVGQRGTTTVSLAEVEAARRELAH